MKRRTMLLVVVVLSLSIVFNVLLPKTGFSASPGPSSLMCPYWCCLFDWGCFLNPFVPNGQWKCCQMVVPGGCLGCIDDTTVCLAVKRFQGGGQGLISWWFVS